MGTLFLGIFKMALIKSTVAAVLMLSAIQTFAQAPAASKAQVPTVSKAQAPAASEAQAPTVSKAQAPATK